MWGLIKRLCVSYKSEYLAKGSQVKDIGIWREPGSSRIDGPMHVLCLPFVSMR